MIEIENLVGTYVNAYRNLIVTERLTDRDIVLSLPLHLAANHRIEITVSEWGNGVYILSDSARTLGEVEAAGYSLNSQVHDRIEKLASTSGVRVVDKHLILETPASETGVAIQKFLEVTKTIGDVYLVHKQREPDEDSALLLQIKAMLDSENILYKSDEKIPGEIERHPFDVLIPSNGHPGVALTVVGAQNTHNAAQIWGFKCEDIKRGDWYKQSRARLALVYDMRFKWSDASKAILESRADKAVPSDTLSLLRDIIARN